MIAYLDSSVLLRILLNQRNKLKEFSEIEKAVSSKLLKTECLRTLDRCRLGNLLTQEQHLEAVAQLYDSLDSVEFLDISDSILERAGSALSMPLGTLDAIHLSSALKWRELSQASPRFLTHDLDLAKAARTMNFEVLGV